MKSVFLHKINDGQETAVNQFDLKAILQNSTGRANKDKDLVEKVLKKICFNLTTHERSFLV